MLHTKQILTTLVVLLILPLPAIGIAQPTGPEFLAGSEAADNFHQAEQYRSRGNIRASQELINDLLSAEQNLNSGLLARVLITHAENCLDSGLIDEAKESLDKLEKITSSLHNANDLHKRQVIARCRQLEKQDKMPEALILAAKHLQDFPRHAPDLVAYLNPDRLLKYRLTLNGLLLANQISVADYTDELLKIGIAITDLKFSVAILDDAIAQCQRHEKLAPQLARLRLERGLKLIDSNPELADEDLEFALNLYQKHATDWPTAKFELSRGYFARGTIDKSKDPPLALKFFRYAAESCDNLKTDNSPIPPLHALTLQAVQEQYLNSLFQGYQLIRHNAASESRQHFAPEDEKPFVRTQLIAAVRTLLKTYDKSLLDSDLRKTLLLLSLATLLAEQNDVEESYKVLQNVDFAKVQVTDPAIAADAKLLLGEVGMGKNIAESRENLKKAMDIGEKLKTQNTLVNRGKLGLGQVGYLTGEYVQARVDFEKVIASTDDQDKQLRFYAHVLHGLSNRSLGRNDLALGDYGQVAQHWGHLPQEQEYLLTLAEIESLIAQRNPVVAIVNDTEIEDRLKRLDAIELEAKARKSEINSRLLIEAKHQRAVFSYLQKQYCSAQKIWEEIINGVHGSVDESVLARCYFYQSRSHFQQWHNELNKSYLDLKQDYDKRRLAYESQRSQYENDESEFNRLARTNSSSVTEEMRANLLRRGELLLAEYDRLQQSVRELQLLKRPSAGGNVGDPKIASASKEFLDPAHTNAWKSRELVAKLEPFPNLRYVVLCNYAQVVQERVRWFGEGDVDDAILAAEAAIEHLEQSRAGTGGGEYARDAFFSLYRFAYDMLVDWYISQKDYKNAWIVAERTRSRTFLDVMALSTNQAEVGDDVTANDVTANDVTANDIAANDIAANDIAANDIAANDITANDITANDVKKLREAREKLALAIQEREVAVYQGNDEDLSEAQLKKIDDAEKDVSQQESSLYSKGLVASRFDKPAAAKIFDKLQAYEDLHLCYYIGEDRGYVIVVGRKDCITEPLPEPKDSGSSFRAKLDTLITRVIDEWDSPIKVNSRLAGELASVLLPGKVLDKLKQQSVGNVYILPHGSMHRLPFEALPVADHYLCDDCRPIAYLSSAMVFDEIAKRQPRSSAKSFLTVGYGASGTHDFACESLEAAGLFENFTALKFVRAKATKSAFVDNCPNSSWIHLSAHGKLEPKSDNLLGYIALAGAGDESKLSVAEIRELKLSAELVMLSACNTRIQDKRTNEEARGFGGEASNSISSAFLVGGAQRVIGTHWEVHAASSQELVVAFFEELTELLDTADDRIDFAELLQQAKLKVRNEYKENPEWNHPYYWAGFTLQGTASDRND